MEVGGKCLKAAHKEVSYMEGRGSAVPKPFLSTFKIRHFSLLYKHKEK